MCVCVCVCVSNKSLEDAYPSLWQYEQQTKSVSYPIHPEMVP